MNTIKNIKQLNGVCTIGQIKTLEIGASLFNRHSRIEFKILNVGKGTIEVRTVQGKSPAENYLSQKDLIARTKEMFNQILPEWDIRVHAIEYAFSVVEVVDSSWIQDKMLKNKVSLKTLVADTGIDKTSLSAFINGKKPLSQGMKAMFYYYFLNRKPQPTERYISFGDED